MIGVVGAGVSDIVEDLLAREPKAFGDCEEPDRSWERPLDFALR